MIEKAWCKIHDARHVILSKKNILRNHVTLSLATIFSTIFVIFLMTGALYYRNQVIIYDDGRILNTFTMESEAEPILKEQGIELDELDYYVFDGFEHSTGKIWVMRAIDVSITDGEKKFLVRAKRYEDVKAVAARAGIMLQDYDSANYPLDYKCEGGESVIISRAFDVNIVYNNENIALKTSGGTVEEVIKEAGITLSELDIVSEQLDTQVYKGINITVNRVEINKRTALKSIPYKTIEKNSNLLALGQSEITTEGIDGSKRVTYYEKSIDGKVISREIINSQIIKEPVDEVVSVGSALAVPYSKREFDEIVLKNGLPVDYEYVVSGKSCAYTAREGSGTASGRELQIGTVAVNPNVIPYGSLLYIVTQDGRSVYGAAVAADTGSFGGSVVVDLYMGLTSENYDTACDWGARYVDVYVINTGKY